MPPRTRQIRGKREVRPNLGPGTSATAHYPASGLAIPHLPGGIPKKAVFNYGLTQFRLVATAFAEGGLLAPRHFNVPGEHPAVAIERALTELIEPHEKQWKFFRDLICINYSLDLPDQIYSSPDRTHDQSHFSFYTTGQTEIYEIGKVLNRVDEAQKGTGKEIIRLIEQASAICGGTVTPCTLYGMLQTEFWWGELDHEMRAGELRDEAENNNMTDAELLKEYGIPSRDEWDALYPRWSYEIFSEERPVFTDKAVIHDFRKPIRNEPELTKACRDLSALVKSIWETEFGDPQFHRTPINDCVNMDDFCDGAQPLLLRWSDDSLSQYIYEQYMTHAAESGQANTELFACIAFNIDELDSVKRGIRQLGKLLQTFTLLDRLLSILITNQSLTQSLR